MLHSQFIINRTFFASAGFEWLCTDKGTRTITAIFLDPDKKADWFKGPPYAVEEVVFDEHEMAQCYQSFEFEMGERAQDLNRSYHPNFSHEDTFKMLGDYGDKKDYPRKKLLKRDRVGNSGEIFHPYSAKRISGVWHVKLFELFTREYSTMPEDDFVLLPLSSEETMRVRSEQLGLQPSSSGQ